MSILTQSQALQWFPFIEALRDGRLEDCINYRQTKAGTEWVWEITKEIDFTRPITDYRIKPTPQACKVKERKSTCKTCGKPICFFTLDLRESSVSNWLHADPDYHIVCGHKAEPHL